PTMPHMCRPFAAPLPLAPPRVAPRAHRGGVRPRLPGMRPGSLIRPTPTIHTLFRVVSRLTARTRAALPHQPAEFRGPARTLRLRRAPQRKGIGGHFLGDDAARSDVGARTDLDGGNEGGIRADEGALADVGEMLGKAVVVAENSSRPDVGSLSD